MKKHAFYILAAVEALVLIGMGITSALTPSSAGDSGGAEMALFFFVIVPLVIVAITTLIYRFSSWRIVRWIAAAVLVIPLPFVAYMVADSGPSAFEKDFKAGRGIFAEGPPTALAEAITQGDAARVRALAPTVAINQRGKYDYSFLSFAFVQPIVDDGVVAALLKAGANPNGTNNSPLTETVFSNDEARLKMLLDAGADPNPHDAAGISDIFYMTQNPKMLGIMLARGMKVDAVDADGWTALMAAVRDGHWVAVDVLLAAGADTGHRAKDGTDLMKVIADAKARDVQAGRQVTPQLVALGQKVASASR